VMMYLKKVDTSFMSPLIYGLFARSLRYAKKIILGISPICLRLIFPHALISNENPYKSTDSFILAGEDGISLVEVMVAITIFAIGILGCFQLQLQATGSIAGANRMSTSTTWATYAVEELLATDYDDLSDVVGGTYAGTAGLDAIGANADGALYVQPDGSVLAAASGNDLYSVYWNIAANQGGATPNDPVLRHVKQVRVIVIRNSGIGAGRMYSHDYFKTDDQW